MLRHSQLQDSFLLQVSRGRYPSLSQVNKFGRNTDIDSGTAEDVWDGGGIWAAPTDARVHDIASTDVNDTAGGTGARTIRIFGLTDWDTPEAYEDITLNGTTNVATTNSYVIIHRMIVTSTGALGPNIGVITATAMDDLTVTAQVNAGEGQTQMAIYGVPRNTAIYGIKFYASVNRANSAAINVALRVNPFPDEQVGVFLIKSTFAVHSQGSAFIERAPMPFRIQEGPAILKIEADSSANNADISAGFDLVLERR